MPMKMIDDHEGEAIAHKGEGMHVGADILAQVA
jgi:hypothetical protein